ncbi:uncharacterized protein VTP21DRAFT_3051 [Calcarisporiella thermophila]|uniref:uncharacterized protein n=1 Tax=Calcarisporiella thermophila TaxID=911321 RepID=UPI0037432DBE
MTSVTYNNSTSSNISSNPSACEISTYDPSPIAHAPLWLRGWANSQKRLSELRTELASNLQAPHLRILRVSQLDADLLDTELFSLLKEQMWNMFSLFRPSLKENYEPELVALLQLALYRFSVYDSGASYGSMLQNLIYRNEKEHLESQVTSAKISPLTHFQRVMYGVLTIGGQYFHNRITRWVTSKGWSECPDGDPRKLFWKILQRAENVFRVLSLINFLVFLYNGKFRTLIDRVLSMRLVYSQRNMTRQVSFEFLNRQLVWHAFTEFLLFIMPLINLERLKVKLSRRVFPRSLAAVSRHTNLPEQICAICHEESPDRGVNECRAHNPYITNCGHIYCYWCIKNKLAIDDEWECRRCGKPVSMINRVLYKSEDNSD